jgi:hypothetical protein
MRDRVYVLGDSISMHYGPYLEAYLRGVMDYARKGGEEEAALDLEHSQGANGGDSSMVHFHEHVRQKQAAFVAGWLVAFTETRNAP